MIEKATFAAGCFWGVEESFRTLEGVKNTTVGYIGGKTENPSYEEVCSDKTGHVEAVLVEFDPSIISYLDLLDVFWKIHDPTQKNRQGPDKGSQYRSAIFYNNKTQENEAVGSKRKLDKSGKFKEKVATEIVAATSFYKAEEYHQQYFLKTGKKVCH